MHYTVVLMPLAKRQSVRIDLWWRQHRLEAAMAFSEDLALVLPRTLHLVVYRVRPRARRVEIISIER